MRQHLGPRRQAQPVSDEPSPWPEALGLRQGQRPAPGAQCTPVILPTHVSMRPSHLGFTDGAVPLLRDSDEMAGVQSLGHAKPPKWGCRYRGSLLFSFPVFVQKIRTAPAAPMCGLCEAGGMRSWTAPSCGDRRQVADVVVSPGQSSGSLQAAGRLSSVGLRVRPLRFTPLLAW